MSSVYFSSAVTTSCSIICQAHHCKGGGNQINEVQCRVTHYSALLIAVSRLRKNYLYSIGSGMSSLNHGAQSSDGRPLCYVTLDISSYLPPAVAVFGHRGAVRHYEHLFRLRLVF